jgi:hypothetical protein
LHKAVSERSELPVERVQELERFRETAIRSMEVVVAAALIGAELIEIAMQYGNREKIRTEVMNEIVGVVGDKFKFLSPYELRKAYRMWAAGEIEAEAMYGGQINAKQVGSVLTAYRDKRRADMAAYLIAVDRIRAEELAEERRQKMREAFESEFPKQLAEAVEGAESWQDIPAFWYDVLKGRGQLEITKAKAWEIWERAEKLAIAEENERIHEKRTSTKLFKAVAERDDIQKSISRRLAVWECYVLPNRNQ